MMQQISHEERAVADTFTPQVSELSDVERRRRVEQLGREIAEWSAELNHRLA